MEQFKAKLRRGKSVLKHGFRRDSSSSRSSIVTSTTTSTRGSHDEKPNQILANGAPSKPQAGTETPSQKAPAVEVPVGQTQKPASPVGIAPASTSNGSVSVPGVVSSSTPSHSSAVEVSDSKQNQTIETVPYSTLSLTAEEAGPHNAIPATPAASSEASQPSTES